MLIGIATETQPLLSRDQLIMAEPNFKPRICTWEDLSYTDAICLLQSETTTEMITDLLTATLNQTVNGGGVQNKRAQITQDLFYYMVLFARKNNFQPDQLSTLFTILKTLHLFCISSPYDNMESCFQLLQDLLLCHSIHRPPYSTLLYDLNQVKLITDYLLQTYFKHFKLYKYAFTKRVLLDIHVKYEGIEDTPIPSQTRLEEMVKESNEKEDEDTQEGEYNSPLIKMIMLPWLYYNV